MFNRLSETLSSLFSRITGAGTLTESSLKDSMQDIERALLSADVPYELTKEIVSTVHSDAVGKKVTASLQPAEQFIKIVHDTLLSVLGGAAASQFSFSIPSTIMVMGLQGAGKTTTIGKLATHLNKEADKRGKKRSIMCGSVDFYRPAAVEQLETVAQHVGIDFYRAESTDPVRAAQEIVAYGKEKGFDHIILDTAGRLHIDSILLEELRAITSLVGIQYRLLVLDAMTGQESLSVAQTFDQAVGFHAGIMTKMDSDVAGGASLAFCWKLKKPIAFVGIGEKPDDLEPFKADRIARRLVGMGDMATLLDRAEEKIKKSEQDQVQRSFTSGRMTLDDFAKQLDMVGRLGSMTSLLRYMPGGMASKVTPEQLSQGEKDMKVFKAILSSMTLKERQVPRILDGSRKKRVARGAGVAVSQVNALLDRFEQTQQYAKLFKKFGRFGI